MAYSDAILFATAPNVQKQSNWQDDPVVQKLKFSNIFLNRSNMIKRKITRDDKKIPNSVDVMAQMKDAHHLYTSYDHSPCNTWNMDETCVTWAIGSVHMYVPSNQQRASNVRIPNTKLRITAIIVEISQWKFRSSDVYHQTFGKLRKKP